MFCHARAATDVYRETVLPEPHVTIIPAQKDSQNALPAGQGSPTSLQKSRGKRPICIHVSPAYCYNFRLISIPIQRHPVMQPMLKHCPGAPLAAAGEKQIYRSVEGPATF